MASVPAKYIKQKELDFDGEIFACMNLPFVIAGIEIHPPPLGVFSLLEVIDSPVVNDFANANAMDICRAFYIAYYRRDSSEYVREWVRQGGKKEHEKPLEWDIIVSKFADSLEVGKLELSDFVEFRNFLIKNSFTGYEMIPDSGGGSYMPYLFGAETIASFMITFNTSDIDKVLWEIPVCLAGHMAACVAKRNGVKGVDRPKCPEDRALQIKLADERELKGELHPWQIAEPDNGLYGLSAVQIKVRPEIKTEYNNILKEFLRAKRAKENNKCQS
jgi:hypothetical protein